MKKDSDLKKDFLMFHRKNPLVYESMLFMARKLLAKGISKYSVRALMYVLRFELDLKTTGKVVKVEGVDRRLKLCNNHSPYYARMLMANHPELRGFFEVREIADDNGIYPDGKTVTRIKRSPVRAQTARSHPIAGMTP